ncbi:MAG TPA: ABC transporter ATP-binding protein [Actinomycetota bacterium]|nr:ABC transporter ATP-binding protein [Actinomycetota bacterium]
MYELTNVAKSYRKGGTVIPALQDVTMRIDDGAFLAVQGPTGHGKTTLLQMLGGLDRPTSGSVVFNGRDLGEMSERELTDVRSRSFGFVFQTFNLIPTLTAQENVETALVPLHSDSSERRRRAMEELEAVGLADRASHFPLELSGGQQQRVAIARALVRQPEVVLADEPTGNLDEAMREEIMELLVSLWRERDRILIVVTHDSAVAARASRRVWLRDGRVAAPEIVDTASA